MKPGYYVFLPRYELLIPYPDGTYEYYSALHGEWLATSFSYTYLSLYKGYNFEFIGEL